ncbi:phosphoglycerate mutase family protein [Ascidiimonas aurantiaca]|uniref:SixA phosphatase family protein n=1 Tax=Ascidiimonas aurantiaca TaxID=1685432 RepID=UPI0030EB3DF7
MKKLFYTITLALIAPVIANAQSSNDIETITTYYLIRHAEKDRSNPENPNPSLKQEGMARALEWAEVFADVKIDAIYSTDYKRTRQTAEPVSLKQKVAISLYDPRNLDLKDFKEDTHGKTVLIVGHSNTTPALTNALAEGSFYQSMDDTDNGSLFIVTVINNRIHHQRLRIN